MRSQGELIARELIALEKVYELKDQNLAYQMMAGQARAIAKAATGHDDTLKSKMEAEVANAKKCMNQLVKSVQSEAQKMNNILMNEERDREVREHRDEVR